MVRFTPPPFFSVKGVPFFLYCKKMSVETETTIDNLAEEKVEKRQQQQATDDMKQELKKMHAILLESSLSIKPSLPLPLLTSASASSGSGSMKPKFSSSSSTDHNLSLVQARNVFCKVKRKYDADGKEIVSTTNSIKSLSISTGEYGKLELELSLSWREVIMPERQEYFPKLIENLNTEHTKLIEQAEGKNIFPSKKQIFASLNAVRPESVKVVILDQEPYHTLGMADGFAFSVLKDCAVEDFPPSLKNIFAEVKRNYPDSLDPEHGHLRSWADQGVLLLNTTLTVSEGSPGSHEKFGWDPFVTAVLKYLDKRGSHLVFMLWGSHAKNKCTKDKVINGKKHLVLQAAHPSPRGAGAFSSFANCKHFIKANEHLKKYNKVPIKWLPKKPILTTSTSTLLPTLSIPNFVSF